MNIGQRVFSADISVAGKKWFSRTFLVSSGEEVPGNNGNRVGERGHRSLFAFHTVWWSALARNDFQKELLACIMAAK